MKNAVLSMLTILFISCGDKATESTVAADQNGVSENTIQIEAIYAKNDKLNVFCKSKGQDYKAEPTVSQMVYASPEMQTISIPLPKYADMENIRIDLSVNPSQTLVTIKNVSINYNGQLIEGDNSAFTKYFNFNEYVAWDPLYFGYKFNNVDGKFFPAMFGNDLLKQKLTAK